MEKSIGHNDLPPVWPYMVLSGVLALWVDFSDYHQQNTSDSLVPVLTSLYRWMPYYWECNRIGMLVPLLAIPFKSPFANLMVQGWLVLFATFATFFLLPRYVLRAPSWPLVGALAAGTFFVLTLPGCAFVSTFGQPQYPVAMALALAALLLTGAASKPGPLRWCLLPALLLILVAQWVNSATILIFSALVMGRALLENRRRLPATDVRRWRWVRGKIDSETALALGLLAAGTIGNFVFRALSTYTDDPVTQGILNPLRWPEAWRGLALNTWVTAVEPGQKGFALLGAVAATLLLVPAIRRRSAGPLRATLILVSAGAVYGLFMGTLEWVLHNYFCFKYWIPVIFFFMVALASAVLGPSAALAGPRARRVLWLLAAPALLGTIAYSHGRPSRARVRAALDHLPHSIPLPQQTADVIATRASHLIAPYGELWVGVFHANLCLYERCEGRTVWGVGGRCWATWDLWGRVAPEDMRVAGVTDGLGGLPNHEVGDYLRICFPPTAVADKRPSLWLFRPVDEMPRDATPSSIGAVLASWHGGFYGLEVSQEVPAENNRWCGATSGKMTLTNTSDHPRTVTFEMLPHTSHQLMSNFWVESTLFSDHRLINFESGPYVRTVTLPPGKHVIRISCDTPPTKDRYGMRSLTFHLRNFKLTEDKDVPVMPPAP
jgi:hypothetical protein